MMLTKTLQLFRRPDLMAGMQINSRETHPWLSQCFHSHQMAVIPAQYQNSWHLGAHKCARLGFAGDGG